MKNGIIVPAHKEITNYLESGADILAVGSESCVHMLPSVESLIAQHRICVEAGLTLRLYTPRVPQQHIRFMKDYITAIAEAELSNFEIVFNDLGLVYGMQSVISSFRHIILGYGYSWSMVQNGLYSDILRDESSETKDIFMQGNNNNNRRLRFLKKLGFTGIEVQCCKEILERTEKIRAAKLSISVVDAYVWGGYSRACATARLNKLEVGKCRAGCGEVYKLELEEMWDVLNNSFPYLGKVEQEIKPLYSALYLLGNLLYQQIPSEQTGDYSVLSENDSLMFHASLAGKDTLHQKINAVALNN